MTKKELQELKKSQDIKFIYKIPCSLYAYPDNIQYIIIGDIQTQDKNNIRMFSLDDWFLRMNNGSFLPYVCSTLSRAYKIKEYLNIYNIPNLLTFRKFILSIDTPSEIIQECLWAMQFIKEYKVNRPDVFHKVYDHKKILNAFLTTIEPMYKMSLNER
ncbi:hypothetical protein [Clostridium sp.]|uniref:hypothetical protein n=1 Tax=Clostridium sp. TaxID=1506 RepID=UPI002FCBD2AF